MSEQGIDLADLVYDIAAGPRTRSRECLGCGRQFRPARDWHFHCSDACRARRWKARQGLIGFALPAAPPPDEAREARERALLKVARERFMRLGLMSVAELASGWQGTGEDIRLALEEQGVRAHHHNAWGALVMAALRQGLLRDTGVTTHCRTKPSHARRTPVLERT